MKKMHHITHQNQFTTVIFFCFSCHLLFIVFLHTLFAAAHAYICVSWCAVHSSMALCICFHFPARRTLFSFICLNGSISDNFCLHFVCRQHLPAAPWLPKYRNHSAYWLRDRKISVFCLLFNLHNHNWGTITTETEKERQTNECISCWMLNACNSIVCSFGVNDVCR